MNAMSFSYSYLINIYTYSYFIKNPQVSGTVKRGSESIYVLFSDSTSGYSFKFSGSKQPCRS